MKADRTQIYIHFIKSKAEMVYTGIEFRAFAEGLQKPLKNLLLLKAEGLGNGHQKNFDLINGATYLKQFIRDEDYRFGDFCFLDYDEDAVIDNLTDEQISHMLFLAHMFRPLERPFFDVLKNRFAYLAHDNGFFCKLYCRYPEEFLNVLASKISVVLSGLTSLSIKPPCRDVVSELLTLAEQGLYMDLKDFTQKEQNILLDVYTIGKITDMDTVYNATEKLKAGALSICKLIYSGQKKEWALTKEL